MDRDLLKEMNALYGDRPDFQIVLRDLLKKEQQKNNIIVEVFKEAVKTTHSDNQYAKEYLTMLKVVKVRFSRGEERNT